MDVLVVAVSGTSGAGKSTLVRHLAEALHALGQRVATVHFDDFTSESDLPGADVSGWLARGAPPHEWRADRMEQHLLDLVARPADEAGSGEGAGHGGRETVVLVEEPFGRARPGVGRLMDISIHLQVPLHVALARRLRRQFVPSAGALDEQSTSELRRYLDRYLDIGAEFYESVEAAAREHADVVLDGLAGADVLLERALAVIVPRLPLPGPAPRREVVTPE